MNNMWENRKIYKWTYTFIKYKEADWGQVKFTGRDQIFQTSRCRHHYVHLPTTFKVNQQFSVCWIYVDFSVKICGKTPNIQVLIKNWDPPPPLPHTHPPNLIHVII